MGGLCGFMIAQSILAAERSEEWKKTKKRLYDLMTTNGSRAV